MFFVGMREKLHTHAKQQVKIINVCTDLLILDF